MADDRLPPAVVELVGSAIHSLEELEVLVFLYNDGHGCSAERLAAQLAIPEALVVGALQSLVLHRLVVQVGVQSPLQYVFAPQHRSLRAAVQQLARVHREDRLELIMLISNQAIDRVRSKISKMITGSERLPPPKKRG